MEESLEVSVRMAEALRDFSFWAALARRKENDLAPTRYEEISHF